MVSLHYANVNILHYDVIMLGFIPFHYANVIMFLYMYVGKQAWCIYGCVYVYMYVLTSIFKRQTCMSLYMYICLYVDIHTRSCMYLCIDGYKKNYMDVSMYMHTESNS